MKKTSDRILKHSLLSALMASILYTPQVMAFTKNVSGGLTVNGETVENGVQNVWNEGKANNITVGGGGSAHRWRSFSAYR